MQYDVTGAHYDSAQVAQALAEALFKANGIPGASASAVMIGGKVVVTASASIKTTTMSLMQVPQMTVSARSTALRRVAGPLLAFLR